MKCMICEFECANLRALGIHLHHRHKDVPLQSYYEKYINTAEHKCLLCGNDTKFISLGLGFRKFCSHACQVRSPECKKAKHKFTPEGLARISAANKKNAAKRMNKARNTCKERYGVDWVSKSSTCKEKVANTNMKLYGNKCSLHGINQKKTEQAMLTKIGYSNPLLSPEIKGKMKTSYKERTGYDGPWANPDVIKKRAANYYDRTGYYFPAQNPEVRKKMKKRYLFDDVYFDSSWELAYYIWLKDHNETFEYQPAVSFEYEYDGQMHTYHPDFKVGDDLIEIKGGQFITDDGKMINPFDRSQDGLYEAKHQCMIVNHVIIVLDPSEYIDYVNEKYTPDFLGLFDVDLPFPYLNPNLDRTGDFEIIHHFHKSIYEATRKNKPSPLQAWQDKKLVYKCALNRLKYMGHCKPSDILQGFNVTKMAPKISLFRPNLAEALIKKYLTEYKTIFDPFSGFSGRMIGAENCGKTYVGQDIHPTHVVETNEIIAYRQYTHSTVAVQDILTDTEKTYDCLFTCPPYGGKEHWNKDNDEVEKTCDEWIDICLQKYHCKRYVFVVDTTDKYKDKIVETLENQSHFGRNNEYVIVIGEPLKANEDLSNFLSL